MQILPKHHASTRDIYLPECEPADMHLTHTVLLGILWSLSWLTGKSQAVTDRSFSCVPVSPRAAAPHRECTAAGEPSPALTLQIIPQLNVQEGSVCQNYCQCF